VPGWKNFLSIGECPAGTGIPACSRPLLRLYQVIALGLEDLLEQRTIVHARLLGEPTEAPAASTDWE
jgi:hypothetical protein